MFCDFYISTSIMPNSNESIDIVLTYDDDETKKVPDESKKMRDELKKKVRDDIKSGLSEKGFKITEEKQEDINFMKIYVDDSAFTYYFNKINFPILPKRNSNDEPTFWKRFFDLFLKEHAEKDTERKQDMEKRSLVAAFILDENNIQSHIKKEVFTSAFLVHNNEMLTELNKTWSSLSNWRYYQPLDFIKNYFGAKVALYFLWLGYYNTMLIIPAFLGVISMLYGIFTLNSDGLSNDICRANITMCPLCSKNCEFWELKDTCIYSKLSYVIDNPVTIANCIFMSIWAAVYLELWQSYCFENMHRWGLTNFKNKNKSARTQQSDLEYGEKKGARFVLSYTIVMLWLLLAFAATAAIIVYRTALVTTKFLSNGEWSLFVIPITADILNLIVITILNIFYDKMAKWLTALEKHRTRQQREDSLILKTYLFKFVNYYSAVFYLAFFKGKFVGYPAKYNLIFGYRQEECQPGGCLMELTVQLMVIMIGERLMELVLENLIPYFKTKNTKKDCNLLKNYNLPKIDSNVLFEEYLAMIIQYGFITFFIMAFPLAPLLALINNIIEMRLDAQKLLTFYRRPIPEQVKDMGVWIKILNGISSLAIASNAFIIAFSSNFIPKLIYAAKLNPERNYDDYLQFALAYFDVSDFQEGMGPDRNPNNVTVCRYLEFRNGPDHPMKYKRPLHYWHIMTIRLAFIIIYHNVVCIIAWFIKRIIPKASKELRTNTKEESKSLKSIEEGKNLI